MEKLSSEIDKRLKSIFNADQLITDPSECWSYGFDNSRAHAMPQAVVFPIEEKQIVKTLQLCNRYKLPVIARGRASNAVGAIIPVQGGIMMSLERMQRIMHVDADNRVMEAECGALNSDIQARAGEKGFFWAPDPSSANYCTLGGNLACCAAGPRAVKYGTTRENTLGLKAILANGDTIKTGVYTTKGVVGYDLTRLLVGSEGTLAVITEATLKLTPMPTEKMTLKVMYNSMTGAAQAVAAIMAQPVTPCALEFMDKTAMQLLRKYKGASIPEKVEAMLIIEVDGTECSIEEGSKAISDAARNVELYDIERAKSEEDVKELWLLRKMLSQTLRELSPNKVNEDVVVPVSKIPYFIAFLEKQAQEYQFPIVNFGHGGNGNIHVNLLADPNDPEIGPRVKQCLNEIFNKVIQLKGTLSGEHGVGLEKQAYIAKEIDPISLELMRKIKSQFDPNHILNPGKMFPL